MSMQISSRVICLVVGSTLCAMASFGTAVAQEITLTPVAETEADVTNDENTDAPEDLALCAGLSQPGEWVGGSAAGSDLATIAAALDLDVSVRARDSSALLFTVSEQTALRLEAAGNPAGDPFITVFDAEGRLVAEDDDGGDGYASKLELTLEPGNYCLGLTDVDGADAEMSLRFGQTDHEPLTQSMDSGQQCLSPDLALLNEHPLDSFMLEEGVTANGTVLQAPAWRFTLAEASALTITATSVNGDPVIGLLDSEGVLLAENDDADGTNSLIEFQSALPAGDYCLAMQDLNGTDNQINVSVMQFDETAYRRQRIANAEISPLPRDEIEMLSLGSIEGSLIDDVALEPTASWVRFDVPADGVISIEAIGQGADPRVVLFDEVGRVIGENDDGPAGLDSLLMSRVRAGSYVLAVIAVDGESASARLVIERFVPAPR